MRAAEQAVSRLLRQLTRHYPHLFTQIWSEPFVFEMGAPKEEGLAGVDSAFYTTTYFIALDNQGEFKGSLPDEEFLAATMGSGFRSARWEDFSRAYESTRLVKEIDVAHWSLDTRQWGPLSEDKESDDSDVEEDDEGVIEVSKGITKTLPVRLKKNASKSSDTSSTLGPKGAPLRPA